MVLVTLDIPDKLLEEMELVQQVYGVGCGEIIHSALRRYLDKQTQLFSEVIKKDSETNY